MKIAAVVVTFNRKEYLVKNIEALLAQVNACLLYTSHIAAGCLTFCLNWKNVWETENIPFSREDFTEESARSSLMYG